MTANHHTIWAYVALASAIIVWGMSFLVTSHVVKTVPVADLLFLRFASAAILLGLIGRRRIFISRRNVVVLLGLAILSPLGYFLFETYGVAYTQPSHVSVIIAAIPTAVYLLSLALRKERLSWGKALGIALAYCGIAFLVTSGRADEGASVFGDLLVLGAVMCAAVRTVLVKDVLTRVTPLQLTFYQFLFGFLFFVPPVLATDTASMITQLTPRVIGEILFLGVFCSAGAFLALHYALSRLEATEVAVSASFVPVITLFAELLMLGAQISPLKALGTAVTIAGVVLTQLTGRKRTQIPLGPNEG